MYGLLHALRSMLLKEFRMTWLHDDQEFSVRLAHTVRAVWSECFGGIANRLHCLQTANCWHHLHLCNAAFATHLSQYHLVILRAEAMWAVIKALLILDLECFDSWAQSTPCRLQ